MRRAREILRDYLERRADAAAAPSDAVTEENLRRLLRHVAAARQPSEQLEPRLLQGMLRESRRTAARRGRGWRLFTRPAWMLLAPAAALAAVAVGVTWHALVTRNPRQMAGLPPQPGLSSQPLPRPIPVPKPRPVIGFALMGELLRRQPGENDWQPVESGAKIRLDDAVSTGPGATGSVVFLDSSVSRLLPDTMVEYTGPVHGPIQRPSLVRLKRGGVWHVVEKGGPTFMVQTPSATATVWGTEFGVAIDAKAKTTLRVKVGKVALQAAHVTVMVAAGMQSVVLPGQAPQPPIRVTPLPRPPAGKSRPGTLKVTPPAKNPQEGPAKDQSDKIFHRSPPPGAPAPESATSGSPPAPSSGSPGPSSGDSENEPKRPISTSR